MTDDHNDLSQTAGASSTAVEEAKGVSLLRRAEERRKEEADTLYLDVPSWGGDLIAAYRIVDRPRLETMVRKIQAEMRDNSNGNARTAADIDLILEANTGLYAYDPTGLDESARRAPIEVDEMVVGFSRINEIMNRPEINSARSAVLYLFKNNAVAISAHALTVARWMRDPSKDPTAEGAE